VNLLVALGKLLIILKLQDILATVVFESIWQFFDYSGVKLSI